VNKKFALGVLVLLVVGVVAGALAVRQNTELQQHASLFNDLNTAGEIDKTNNPDGTMGPATWERNFSNTLPAAYLGSLNFQVTDPEQGKRPSVTITTVALPTAHATPTLTVVPTHTEDTENHKPSGTPGADNNPGGPQAVTALTLVVTKVEVHLARLGVPGAKNQITPTHVTGKPSSTPGPRNDNGNDNQNVDKWETLNIGGTQTVDLVQLAKTKAFASLGLTKLANGFYTEVRLYIKTATATLTNGTKVDLTIPGKANIVRVVEPFTIDSSKTTTLSMDFDAENSVIKAGSKYLLKPVVAKFNQTNQQ